MTGSRSEVTRRKKTRWLDRGMLLLLVSLVGGWALSEFRWAQLNNPAGKFSNLEEYLAAGRGPSFVTRTRKGDESFLMAHSPMDTWLAVPSAPAAYVFDAGGVLVDWSPDPGDDPAFRERWPRGEEVPLSALRQLSP